jgi:hypothetical protein
MKEKKVKQVLSGDWCQWEEGGHKGRQKEYYGLMYKNGTMKPADAVLRMGEVG